jgi:hypothetical protein
MRDKQTPTKIQRKRKLVNSSIHNIIAPRTHIRTSLSTATVSPTLHLCCPCMFDHQTHPKSNLSRAMQYGEEEDTSPLQCKWMVLRCERSSHNDVFHLDFAIVLGFSAFSWIHVFLQIYSAIKYPYMHICTWGLCNATNILSMILQNNTMLQRWKKKARQTWLSNPKCIAHTICNLIQNLIRI